MTEKNVNVNVLSSVINQVSQILRKNVAINDVWTAQSLFVKAKVVIFINV